MGETEQPPREPETSSQALQRAPTLIAGKTGGRGGVVQVWSPGNLALLRAAGPPGMAAIPLVLISLLCIFPAIFMGQAVGLFFGLVTGAYGIEKFLRARALLRPVYLAADEEGMSISDHVGPSRAIRWADLQALEVVWTREEFVPPYLTLTLWAPNAVNIRLVGYSKAQQQRLLPLMVLKARLGKHPDREGLWVRQLNWAPGLEKAAPLPLWQRLTPAAQIIMAAAEEEAKRRRDPEVTPEHILLAPFKVDDARIRNILTLWGLHERERERISNTLKDTKVRRPLQTPVTLSARTRRLLEHADEQRRSAGGKGIGVEYLLLGILGEGHGAAFTALTEVGVDASRFRREAGKE